MTGEELRKRRQAIGLTMGALAEELRVSQNTVARWERGLVRMPGMIELLLPTIEAKYDAERLNA
jgi:transcriptional regulator with XRE-family HTH domain